MRSLFPFFKGYRKQLVLGPLFKLTEAILELMIPLLMASIIDTGIKNGDVHYIVTHGALMIGLGAVGLACALTCQYFAAVCAQGFGRSLRRALFRRVMLLSQKEYGAVGTDSLITRLTNDTNQVQTGVNMFIRMAMRAPFLSIGSIVMAFTINAHIALLFLAATPLIVAVLALVMRRSVPYYAHIQQGQDTLSRMAGENLSGARVIRAFTRQETEKKQFDGAGDELAAATVRVGKIAAALNPVTMVIVNLAIVGIIWWGGLYADTGVLQQGQIIALVNYMNQTLLALVALANLIVIFTRAAASAQRVAEVLRLESSMDDPEQAPAPVAGAPRIAFDHVTFAYHAGGDAAIEDLSFTVAAGQTLGVIGGTGCGKTTLAALLGRVYDTTAGAVRLDGVDVRALPLAQLHARIGLVPQAATLFAGTVRSNLQLGAPGASDDALWHALELAQAKEFMEKLEKGLDTPVEEGGKNFSGGQRQRLTIARALAREPQILILDDAASALDYATDAALRRALKTGTRGMTVVMISQRASTLKNADSILVLDDGRSVGFGTHAALLESCAVYRDICRTQGLLQEADV